MTNGAISTGTTRPTKADQTKPMGSEPNGVKNPTGVSKQGKHMGMVDMVDAGPGGGYDHQGHNGRMPGGGK